MRLNPIYGGRPQIPGNSPLTKSIIRKKRMISMGLLRSARAVAGLKTALEGPPPFTRPRVGLSRPNPSKSLLEAFPGLPGRAGRLLFRQATS